MSASRGSGTALSRARNVCCSNTCQRSLRHQLVLGAEADEVEIILGRFHENNVLAPGAGQVAGNLVVEKAVLDGRLVTVERA